MLSLTCTEVVNKLPVSELQQTIAEFVQPVSTRLPDARLPRLIPLAVRGILSSESPVITQMAQGIPRTKGSVWAVAKRF